MTTTRFSARTKRLVYLAVLSALVVVFQFAGSFIRFGNFSCTLVLPCIVIGVALCGKFAGLWLGAVFAGMVFVTHDADAFLAVNPAATILVVVTKGMLAGLAAGLIYALLAKRNRYLAVIGAAVISPIVNTGIFLIGCRLFFYDTVVAWGQALGFTSGAAYLFLGLAGGNFLLEFVINLVLAPSIVRLLDILRNMIRD